MTEKTHPFVPGTEVAFQVRHGWSDTRWRKGKVAKVHKTGRFVLEGDTRQWTPTAYRVRHDSQWAARDANGNNLELMSPKIAAEMQRDAELDKRSLLLRQIGKALEKVDAEDITSTAELEGVYNTLLRVLGKDKS